MSAANSVMLNTAQADVKVERSGFGIPEELGAIYQVRIIETPDSAERRVGLFLAGDRTNPALEIAHERIIAHRQDAQTVDALVKLAKHNGWEKIDVEGSPEFRKAVWAEATREGLAVNGYEPTFGEQEQMAAQRRQDTERRDREAHWPDPNKKVDAARESDAQTVAAVMEAATSSAGDGNSAPLSRAACKDSEHDSSAPVAAEARADLPVQDRGVVERIVERSIQELEARGDPGAARAMASALLDQVYGERKDRAGEHAAPEQTVRDKPQSPQVSVQDTRLQDASSPQNDSPLRDKSPGRRPQGEELAELFRHGAAETIAADPRLAKAREAQIVMELHIAEVFKGDAARTAAANLESRHMISDVLRRGLDVAVREPPQVRQIEPVKNLEMER